MRQILLAILLLQVYILSISCRNEVIENNNITDSCDENNFLASLDYDSSLSIIDLTDKKLPLLKAYLGSISLPYSDAGIARVFLQLPHDHSSILLPVYVYSPSRALHCGAVNRRYLLLNKKNEAVYNSIAIIDTSQLIKELSNSLLKNDLLTGRRPKIGFDWDENVKNEMVLPYLLAIHQAYLNAAKETLFAKTGHKNLCALKDVPRERLIDEFPFNLTIFVEPKNQH